jgi:hypothetical protein
MQSFADENKDNIDNSVIQQYTFISGVYLLEQIKMQLEICY